MNDSLPILIAEEDLKQRFAKYFFTLVMSDDQFQQCCLHQNLEYAV